MSEAARRRLEEAMRLLGADPATADALTCADALWLARVLPDADIDAGDADPGASGSVEGAAGALSAGSVRSGVVANDSTGASRTGDGASVDRPASNTTSLFVQQDGFADEPMLRARRVPVPAADALPDRAALERALRPFLRRRPSPVRREVDAAATAEASAEASADALRTGDRRTCAAPALVPVLRPVPERWFDVVLLAERDDTMRVFDDTLRELRLLLARHGAFRRVGLWRWRVQGGAVHVETAAGMPCAPRAMLQGQHPQLVWMLTHGASARWTEAPLRDFVRRLAAQSVVAIVQLLPETAWGATALGVTRERVRSRERAATNRQLLRRDPWAEVWSREGASGVVPLLSLQAGALARWADFVMSPRATEHAAVALEPVEPESFEDAALLSAPASAPPQSDPAAVAPALFREQVLRFKAIASPQAFALLRLLSGAWITLPVVRLLQHSLPAPRTLAPLAEVLLSGLLRRTSATDVRTEELSFDFLPGMREWLSGSLSGEERRLLDAAMADSREAIRLFVETRLNRTLNSFGALLLDPAGDEFLPASARSFVEVSRRLRVLRGGAEAAPFAAATGTANGAAHGSSQPALLYKIVLLGSVALINVMRELELNIKRAGSQWQLKGIQMDLSQWLSDSRSSEQSAAKTTRAIIESDLVVLVESELGPSISGALDDAWSALIDSPDKRPLLLCFLGQEEQQDEPPMLPHLGRAHQLTWKYQVFTDEGELKDLVLKELDSIMSLLLKTNARNT